MGFDEELARTKARASLKWGEAKRKNWAVPLMIVAAILVVALIGWAISAGALRT